MQLFATAIALCAIATSALAQFSVVIPAGTDVAPGNSSNAFPWGNTAAGWGGLRLMCIYDAVNFTTQNVTAPILINRLRWRPDNGTGAVVGGTYSIADVRLSTAPMDYSLLTTNFGTNHGPDLTTVYSGPVVHTPTTGAAGWTTTSWCVDVQFPSPFLYDPSAGDLVIDVDYPTGSFVGGSVGQMDVGGLGSNAGRIWASSMYPTANGTALNHGVVVEVGYVPSTGFGYSLPYGEGCVEMATDSFYEEFAPNTFDLSNTAIQFLPTGSGYVAVPAAPAWFTPTAPNLALADNALSAPQALGFTLSYPGGTTSSVVIGSNGFLWPQTNTNSGCCNGLPSGLLTQGARWSPLWTDLNPALGGTIHFDTDPANGAAYVTYSQVAEAGGTNTCTFQVAFFNTGAVEYRYQACSVLGHQTVTGWSPGNNNLDPGSVDLTTSLPIVTAPDILALRHTASARPVIGAATALNTNNLTASAVIGATLFGLTAINPGLDLTSLGMPGCRQFVSIDASAIWVPSSNVGTTVFSIPNDPGLAGVEIKTQGVALVPGMNPLGALSTNGLRHILDLN